MNGFFEIAASAAECLIIVCFCNRYLGIKNKRHIFLASAVFFVLTCIQNIMLSSKSGFELISVFLHILTAFVYSLLFLKGRVYEKILVSILPLISILLINQFLITGFCAISNSPVSDVIEPNGRLRLQVLFLSKLTFFVICEILIRVRTRGKNSLSYFQWIVQLLCFFNTFLIAITLWEISKDFTEMRENFIYMHMMIAIMNVLMYIMLNKMQSDSVEKEKLRILKITLASQEKFVEEARANYAEMKTLRHDIRHCITAAAALISDGKAEDAKNYLEKIFDEKVGGNIAGVDTGNAVIDAVINNRIADCSQNNIEIKCLIDSHFEGISDTDISILLSNVLDNAICGCKGVVSPEIELVIGTRMSFTYVIVRNSIPKSVLSQNPELKTNKDDKAIHGLGIDSMRRIAKKYGGSVEFREGASVFIAEIWLNRQK